MWRMIPSGAGDALTFHLTNQSWGPSMELQLHAWRRLPIPQTFSPPIATPHCGLHTSTFEWNSKRKTFCSPGRTSVQDPASWFFPSSTWFYIQLAFKIFGTISMKFPRLQTHSRLSRHHWGQHTREISFGRERCNCYCLLKCRCYSATFKEWSTSVTKQRPEASRNIARTRTKHSTISFQCPPCIFLKRPPCLSQSVRASRSLEQVGVLK